MHTSALKKEVNKVVDPSNDLNTTEIHDGLDVNNEDVNTHENNTMKNEDESPVELWIAKSPTARKPEVDYLLSFNPEFPVSISERGNLQKPFKAGTWTFLMELDKSFPKPTEENSPKMTATHGRIVFLFADAEDAERLIR